ncbi:MAG: AAA family ATPase, partial [Planctomycetaceae bacterium]
YTESYTKGVHDTDAGQILIQLVKMQQTIGLLRFHTCARALAGLFWQSFCDRKTRSLIAPKLQGIGAASDVFENITGNHDSVTELAELISAFVHSRKLFSDEFVNEAAEYLYHELTSGSQFAVSSLAGRLCDEFRIYLKRNNSQDVFQASVEAVHKDAAGCFVLLRTWVTGFLATTETVRDLDYVDEVALILMPGKPDGKQVVDGIVDADLDGMVGTHPVINGGSYHLNYTEFMHRVERFDSISVPRFNDYVELKHDIVERTREHMRLDEFRPRVLTSFVRNRLLNEVYLPLIGDNLAKQIGVAGEGKRTDLMGLLLLVSPPGYGKTTLMEYIANRLGLIFMKVNGPALGHNVTSLDPSETTNAGAREEVEKLNLALEMGDNVMIYLDDIQHTNPEFLQKFISLCDAQRKIEGVYKGRTRTYDLRGRKVAVVMAGNPYTESGEKFQIPDMLSNRADIYNLGEIIGESSAAFEMSYLENALTSNPVLSQLASKSQQDVYSIIRLANNEPRDSIDFEGSYSLEEINELTDTMRKLMRVRDVILAVNQEYIRSAAQSDDYRTEPAFKLQGSYRNMNRIAEKVISIMNDEELTSLIVSNYENDAQTLTTGTEANLLKFKELTGLSTPEETERWDTIKRTFRQNVKLRGIGKDDKTGQVIAQLGILGDGLDSIRKAMADGVTHLASQHMEEAPQSGPDPVTAENHKQTEEFIQALTERFAGVESGLQAINTSLSTGMSEFAALVDRSPAMPESVEHPAPPAGRPVADPPATGKAAADQDNTADDTGDKRITIINRVPKSLTTVVKEQFTLMNEWLEPIHRATGRQRSEMRKIREQIDFCLKSYQALLERIERKL